MAIGEVGARALVALSPFGLPRAGAMSVDRAVYASGPGITSLVGLVVGLVPALQASHSDLHNALRQSSRTTTGGHQLTRQMRVVAEVAFALVLLAGAGPLLRILAVDSGFTSSHLLTMQVQEFTSPTRVEDTHFGTGCILLDLTIGCSTNLMSSRETSVPAMQIRCRPGIENHTNQQPVQPFHIRRNRE